MSEAAQIRPSDSLLYSDQLFRVLGGDAMQILRCGICMEFFDVPIVLPCGHTFCLHCLTEMCKHASRNCVLSPLKDLRIGCPNCRVLIYVSPILERNVTCNFIIQSLIECLRSRAGGKRQNIGVNTDEVRVGSRIRTVNDLEMERVIKEVDRMTDALGKRNVIDNAYFEIDEIRRQYLAQQAQVQGEDEEQLQNKSRNQARSIQQCPKQLRLQQQPFYQQQQCQRSFNWEDLNGQFKTTPASSFHHQQPQQPNFKLHSKFQLQQQLQPQQQPMPSAATTTAAAGFSVPAESTVSAPAAFATTATAATEIPDAAAAAATSTAAITTTTTATTTATSTITTAATATSLDQLAKDFQNGDGTSAAAVPGCWALSWTPGTGRGSSGTFISSRQ
ncbi:unnamed protein product [Candidula unifasciata]|uniref:RING-type domain-containing protein n=1 Tax=Candidula unifasciata TaxID=100452 RepID=A0A8S3YT87_9EUPU|nr:unnamed protein product [Candidula unifasciata]